MKPVPFSYFAPETVSAAVALLAEHGDDAKVISGGQSLMPLLSMRLVRPKVLVDLGTVKELSYIRETPDGLAIGAMTRHRDVELSPVVARICPLLTEAVKQVGHVAIRHRGTIGGSIAHADPAAEMPGVAVALDAVLVVTGPDGQRTIPAREFFSAYFTTSMMPGEILTEVRFPRLSDKAGCAFVELARRHGDFALVGVAAVLTPGAAGTIAEARLSLIGVGMTPVRALAAEQALVGRPADAAAFQAAAAAAQLEVDPEGDVHGTAEYRRHVAGVLVEQALAQAWSSVKA